MAASLEDAILMLQLILLLLPVVAALFQITLRTHRKSESISPRVIALGMFSLVMAVYFLAFAALDVTGFIRSRVESGLLISATNYIRFAVLLILGFAFLFGIEAIPEVETRSFRESIQVIFGRRTTSEEDEVEEEQGDG